MSWAGRRRFTYAVGAILALLIVAGLAFTLTYYDTPTCFDGKKNGAETNVDCGGECERLCVSQVAPPIVLWSRSFEVTPGIYNSVAYVENPNRDAGIEEITYTFQLFDKNNVLIADRSGTTFIAPNQITPVFAAAIETKGRIPARTFFEFSTAPLWKKAVDTSDALSISRKELTRPDSKPRINATITNSSVQEFTDIEVVAVVFGVDGNAVAASKTFINLLEKQSSQNIVFTWPQPLPTTIEQCTIPADVILLLDTSGSMNDDGDNPPQPITDAKQAVASFIGRLSVEDRAGLISFATIARFEHRLSIAREEVQKVAQTITILPEEESGFTNLGDALSLALDELLFSFREKVARKVVVLVTDGKANAPEKPGGEPYAIEQAVEAQQKGLTLYAIGLGDEVNDLFLEVVAGSPDRYFQAADSVELDGIYKEISSEICERGPAIIEIIPTTRDAFLTTP